MQTHAAHERTGLTPAEIISPPHASDDGTRTHGLQKIVRCADPGRRRGTVRKSSIAIGTGGAAKEPIYQA